MLLGSGERQSFRPQEFAAYARRVHARLEEFVADGRETRPYPCDALRDLRLPAALRRLVGRDRQPLPRRRRRAPRDGEARAGRDHDPDRARARDRARRAQRRALRQAPAPGRASSSSAARPASPSTSSSRRTPTPASRSCPTPRPATSSSTSRATRSGTSDGSLEYLWGVLDADDDFTPLWAHDHPSEQAALEAFVDLVHARLREHPDMHVYHYAAYEVSALRRLMGRYGTREAEVDDLLRRGVLVDLLKVVRGGVVASVPGYGLKEMEVFLDFDRTAEIRDGGTSIVEHERYIADARPGDPRRDRRTTTGRTASRPGSCATGCSSGARRPARSRRPSPSSRRRRRREGGARRAAGRAARGGRGARRRSSSTTTTASASPSGGRSSTGSR